MTNFTQDLFLVFHMLNLFELDDIGHRQYLQGIVSIALLILAQAYPGKGSCADNL